MPRRGSRAQLIHLLADFEAWAHREVLGYHEMRPHDFYQSYQRLSTAELREQAAGLTPNKRGRPKAARVGRSRQRECVYAQLSAEVAKVLKAGKRKSERGACRYVADKAGVSEHYLRTLCRARRIRI